MVSNEIKELELLLERINEYKDKEDEIVILYDLDSTNSKTIEYLESKKEIKIFSNALKKDFSQQKNFLFSKCSGDYIINIDADELPHRTFLKNIKSIINENSNYDLFYVPRINLVEGITDEYIQQMKWNKNHLGWINFPDFQSRIVRNSRDIFWENKVHERIVGAKKIIHILPYEVFSFYHIKDMNKQVSQNNFYSSIK